MVIIMAAEVHSSSSSTAYSSCQYVRTLQKLSSDCFAENECMQRCGVIRDNCIPKQEKICKTEHKKKCSTIIENKCKTSSKQVCHPEYEDLCDTVTVPDCKTDTEEKCDTTYEEECAINEVEICNDVNKLECDTVVEDHLSRQPKSHLSFLIYEHP